MYVHVGGCHMMGKRSRGATREQVVRALTDGVDPCPPCRPHRSRHARLTAARRGVESVRHPLVAPFARTGVVCR
ncbi:DUF6233 domain-containing protein [Streptomyces sp. NPDC088357]|uniref:DUF6233 domain-containing protein n=1 Tax=Streptomyces sp. NPDC088357 TaxID=3154655 RepID=UPI003420FC54